jgi:hypothetical protein
MNSKGRRITGSTRLLAENREGKIEIHAGDPEVFLPSDVLTSLPDPLCRGAVLFGTAGHERVLVHFPVNKRHPEAAFACIKILDQIKEEVFHAPDEQTIFSLKVTGDWHQLRLGGAKTLLFSIHEVEMERRKATSS